MDAEYGGGSRSTLSATLCKLVLGAGAPLTIWSSVCGAITPVSGDAVRVSVEMTCECDAGDTKVRVLLWDLVLGVYPSLYHYQTVACT